MSPERKLAAAVVEDCYRVLSTEPPTKVRPPKGKDRDKWVIAWERWEADRLREIKWLNSPRAVVWCELAGLDHDAVMDGLRAQGLLYDAATRFPVDMGGRSLVYG